MAESNAPLFDRTTVIVLATAAVLATTVILVAPFGPPSAGSGLSYVLGGFGTLFVAGVAINRNAIDYYSLASTMIGLLGRDRARMFYGAIGGLVVGLGFALP